MRNGPALLPGRSIHTPALGFDQLVAAEICLEGHAVQRFAVGTDLAGIIPLRWCARTPDYTRAGELLGQVVAPQGNVVL